MAGEKISSSELNARDSNRYLAIEVSRRNPDAAIEYARRRVAEEHIKMQAAAAAATVRIEEIRKKQAQKNSAVTRELKIANGGTIVNNLSQNGKGTQK